MTVCYIAKGKVYKKREVVQRGREGVLRECTCEERGTAWRRRDEAAKCEGQTRDNCLGVWEGQRGTNRQGGVARTENARLVKVYTS